MSVSEQYRIEQRHKVLLAARKCFVRHGFHATGMAEIAKACQMSVGNIYHYFPNKDAIVKAITDEIRSRMLPVLQPLGNHSDPREGLIQVMLLSLREICTGSNAVLWMEILAEVPRNKVIRSVCMAFDSELRELVKHLMQRAIDAKQLSPKIDPEATSLWLIALLDGAIARLIVEPDLDFTHAHDTLAQHLRRFFSTCGA